MTVRRDGSLHIERVRLDDAGDYTCLAENVVGATNHTTAVNVYGSVRKQTYKQTISSRICSSCILQQSSKGYVLQSKVPGVIYAGIQAKLFAHRDTAAMKTHH